MQYTHSMCWPHLSYRQFSGTFPYCLITQNQKLHQNRGPRPPGLMRNERHFKIMPLIYSCGAARFNVSSTCNTTASCRNTERSFFGSSFLFFMFSLLPKEFVVAKPWKLGWDIPLSEEQIIKGTADDFWQKWIWQFVCYSHWHLGSLVMHSGNINRVYQNNFCFWSRLVFAINYLLLLPSESHPLYE